VVREDRGVSGLDLHLGEDALERLAELVAAKVAARMDGTSAASSPWMTAEEAADYLRCSVSRLRKLSMHRELAAHRDGGRVLYRREELDAFITDGGASTGR
jgi:excisionase family DNA binding protein